MQVILQYILIPLLLFKDEQMDESVVETYRGDWKNDKRTGFGVSERSDGLRYEGEWFNNRKYGYGVTTFRDGSKEEGKYKNNVLITSQRRRHLFLIRSAKFRARIDTSVAAAQRAMRMALQKEDIAISRSATARGKAELADQAAEHAREESELAQQTAKQFAPDFKQPGLERLKSRDVPRYIPPLPTNTTNKNPLLKNSSIDQTSLGSEKPQHQLLHHPQAYLETIDSKLNEPDVATPGPLLMRQSMRRPSVKQLPQNQLVSDPTSPLGQNQLPNQFSPIRTSLTNPHLGINPYMQQANMQHNQYSNMPGMPSPVYQPGMPQFPNNQFVQPNPYGIQGSQYPQEMYQNYQNVDQYGNYVQPMMPGFQNQYQPAPGFLNQQVVKTNCVSIILRN